MANRVPDAKLEQRAEVVKAMDLLVRCINDERHILSWWALGVADGDIKKDTTAEDLEIYCEDDTFRDLMTFFLKLMNKASEHGLYCDRVTSGCKTVTWDLSWEKK